MFRLDAERPVTFCDGSRRRDFLHAGSLSLLGLGLTELSALKALGAVRKDASDVNCILMMLVGGPSQLDTWDMKPNAPAEIRGPYKPDQDQRSGDRDLRRSFPRMAKHADKYALDPQRLSHGRRGARHRPPDDADRPAVSGRHRVPALSAASSRKLKGPKGDVPAHVLLPRPIGNTGGNMPHGQNAGFLGKAFDPFVLNADPSDPNFQSAGHAAAGLPCRRCGWTAAGTGARWWTRLSAVRNLTGRAPARHHLPPGLHADVLAESARGLRTAPESRKTCARSTGINRFGQSCLLARRLIEAGVRFVTVNMFETVFDEITWDIHGSKPFSPISCYRDLVGPMFDNAYSSLLEDLSERGLLDNTHGGGDGRVRTHAQGESGRRPRPLAAVLDDRLMAGGGVKGGQVVGLRTKSARSPKDRPATPAEVAATMYHGLGIQTWKRNCRARRAGRSAGGPRRRSRIEGTLLPEDPVMRMFIAAVASLLPLRRADGVDPACRSGGTERSAKRGSSCSPRPR